MTRRTFTQVLAAAVPLSAFHRSPPICETTESFTRRTPMLLQRSGFGKRDSDCSFITGCIRCWVVTNGCNTARESLSRSTRNSPDNFMPIDSTQIGSTLRRSRRRCATSQSPRDMMIVSACSVQTKQISACSTVLPNRILSRKWQKPATATVLGYACITRTVATGNIPRTEQRRMGWKCAARL